MRFTLSVSPAPAKRATSTLIPVKIEEMKMMTTMKIWHEHADGGVAGVADRVPDDHLVDDALEPADDVDSIVGHASRHTARASGPSTMERS